ncbi:hypothetical protein POL68_25045 [Stigmatella sp. ncwal1]|uniref:Uncharacterized protein n=1 Tax=Stigmatella ashevillensis TaxID=2995309 RepID=A0ABT5DDK3_9BACT|nr:hypothetical protein [Stigmatella ashevillena]MDC0711760.1 hypothetical protein [Stigmatella ashevillena]
MGTGNRHLRALASLLVVSGLLYSGASFAQNAISGPANDGAYITVPEGTTINDWALMISPTVMGAEETNSEGDNALLKIETYAVVINSYTWRVVARYKFKWWNDARVNGIWSSGSANYLMVRKTHPHGG